MDYIKINSYSDVPKYRQIIQSVHTAIRTGQLKRGDKIPSLNEIKDTFGLSRDTVLTAFKEMKNNKLIVSTPGKGYYISSTNVYQEEKIFLLFDELNAFKEDLYNAFLEEVGRKASVEIYFHHFNLQVLKNLIEENQSNYTSFVIMPGSLMNISGALKKLPIEKTYILDRKNTLKGAYGMVVQNFEKDIYNALKEGKTLLDKYKKLVIIYPEDKEPYERVTGFINFCTEYNIPYEVWNTMNGNAVKKGEVYFVMNDRHLVTVIQQIDAKHLKVGTDVGIVSFNDTMLKQVVAGGITTISTDFTEMGKSMAQMVMNRANQYMENPATLIIRKSL